MILAATDILERLLNSKYKKLKSFRVMILLKSKTKILTQIMNVYVDFHHIQIKHFENLNISIENYRVFEFNK